MKLCMTLDTHALRSSIVRKVSMCFREFWVIRSTFSMSAPASRAVREMTIISSVILGLMASRLELLAT